MKRSLTYFLTALILFAVGCSESYDDSALVGRVDNLETRITKLEDLCKQMNTNILSLQTIVAALQSNDHITNISPITEGGKTIGYIISFSKNGNITIYHGKDGQNGADGKDGTNGTNGKDGKDGVDGHTPQIGVKQDTDGIYYWILDGDWLLDNDGNKIKAQGIDGKDGVDGTDGINGTDGKDGVDGKDGINGTDGKDGVDGKDGINGTDGKDGVDGKDGINGTDGKDGVDGKDGITPQLKIEDEYWYISYDNGASWTKLYKAKGENGDSLFKSITQDDNNVYLEMADGNVITIAKTYNLSITFNSEDLGQLLIPGNTYQIRYTVQSGTKSVDIELVPSGNITARVVADNASKLSGSIEIVAGQTVDAETNIIIFVYNGNKVVMKSLEFEAAGIKSYDNPATELPQEGGTAKLEFLSNVECVPVIPTSAQSWISVAPSVRSTMKYGAVFLTISPNDKSTPRSATVRVESTDGTFGVDYIINQAGGHAYNEIWYTTNSGKKIELNKNDGFGTAFLTNTYSDGKGVIKFESAITLVGQSAFKGCTTLTSIELPDGITSIGASAFSECTALTQLEIPESVNSIGASAFNGCSALTAIEIPEAVNSIGESAFSGCTSLRNFKMPDAVTSVESRLFSECTSLADISLSKNIISIGSSAFYGCTSLRNITIPNGLTTIGANAFRNCNGLTNISIPDSVITIEFGAFAMCSLLTNVTFGKNITSIGGGAFYDCDGITSLNIPDSVISIKIGAFWACDGLRTATLGKNIATIGSGAFYNCSNLSSIYIKATTPPVLYGNGNPYSIGESSITCNWSSGYYNFKDQHKPDNLIIYVPLYSLNNYKQDWSASYYDDDNILEGYEFE